MTTDLNTNHYDHLLSEGFTDDEIAQVEIFGAKSMSKTQAERLGIKKWDGQKHISDGGLYFPFHEEYGQIRLNTPIEMGGEKFKYLGPSKPVKAWFPRTKVEAITEGWKDAAMPTVRGLATAAIVGVDNIIHCIEKGCETPIIFDSDGWRKPQVVRGLIVGAIWTNGKINLFPQMPDHPTGGACEYFKTHSITDYQELLNSAMKPDDFLVEWTNHWKDFDYRLKAKCARIATNLSHILEKPDKYLEYLEMKVEEKKQEWIKRVS